MNESHFSQFQVRNVSFPSHFFILLYQSILKIYFFLINVTEQIFIQFHFGILFQLYHFRNSFEYDFELMQFIDYFFFSTSFSVI